jgi:tripeptide aminopeptidase
MSSPQPDSNRLLKTFLALLNVDTFHGDEDRAVAIVQDLLKPARIAFKRDQIGNLIGSWPARNSDSEPIMLNAHLDTVQSTAGLQTVVGDEGVGTDGSTILGADDKAGVAAIVEAVLTIESSGAAHGPVDLVFTGGEDVGHIGSKAFDPASIESTVGFVLDAGSPVGNVVTEAPGTRQIHAEFHGRAAHAGIEPEAGISAISIMSRAIDNMPLGRIDPGTVANIGTVTGGQAANIVAPHAKMEAQARSLSEQRLDEQIDAMCRAMDAAADHFGGSVEYEVIPFVRAYRLEAGNPALELADRAIRAAGIKPKHVPTGGGSDAHEFNAKGMTTACLGAGYRDAHAVTEFMPHDQLRLLADVSIQLVLNA